jgi:hypothetical protein
MERITARTVTLLVFSVAAAALAAIGPSCSSIDVPKNAGAPPRDSKGAFDNKEFDAVLKRYVNKDGLVDYGSLRIDHSKLDKYLGELAATSPDNDKSLFPNRWHQVAYWVNAYNACAIKEVIERNITDTVADTIFAENNFFRRHTFEIGGSALNLNEIEDRATGYNEARVLFVMNRASWGAPRLRNEALTGENADKLMEDAANEFCNDARNVDTSKGSTTVTLNKLFSWRSDVFESYARVRGIANANIRDAINLWRPKDMKLPINGDNLFRDYDWALNKQNTIPANAAASK